jgi:hypothetical protein
MKTKDESFKHNAAKDTLIYFLKKRPELIDIKEILRIGVEEQFAMCGIIWFICDITIYDETGIIKLIEVDNKHSVDEEKLEKMNIYFNVHGYYPELIEIKSDAILQNTGIPEKLYFKKLNYKTKKP